MTSEELANDVEAIIRSVKTRIVGVGQDQYDNGDVQRIETKSASNLLTETIEELDDAIVYLAHLRSRLTRISPPNEN